MRKRKRAKRFRAELTRARAEIERLRACEIERRRSKGRAPISNGRRGRSRVAPPTPTRCARSSTKRSARLAATARKAVDADKLRGVEESRRELAIEAEVLRARLHDADYVRAENATLRAASRESSELARRCAISKNRLAGNVPDMERTIREPHLSSAGAGPARFREVLDRLAKHPAVSAATVADDLGFPVETIGDHADALAALSGFLALVANKARQLLPRDRYAESSSSTTTTRPSPPAAT